MFFVCMQNLITAFLHKRAFEINSIVFGLKTSYILSVVVKILFCGTFSTNQRCAKFLFVSFRFDSFRYDFFMFIYFFKFGFIN
jgi:hypothetical protein